MARKFTPTKADASAISAAIFRLDKLKAAASDRKRKAATALRLKRDRERREHAATVRAKRTVELPGALRMEWPIAGWKVIVARMEPDTWYLSAQIHDLMPEAPRGSVRAWLWDRAVKLGYVERAGNPDFDPNAPAVVMQARYLYRVAQNRTQEAQEWREALGIGNPTSEE